jgi:DNA end-binding protein Ku
MSEMDRCALARWAWKGKQYMVQVRPADGGLVLQQLLYADEVRGLGELEIEKADVKPAELALAKQLIEQGATDEYDPKAYVDEVKKRIEAAVQQKVEGKEVTVSEEPEAGGAQVIDLMEALRASLGKGAAAPAPAAEEAAPAKAAAKAERKPPKRVAAETTAEAAPRTRARKTG